MPKHAARRECSARLARSGWRSPEILPHQLTSYPAKRAVRDGRSGSRRAPWPARRLLYSLFGPLRAPTAKGRARGRVALPAANRHRAKKVPWGPADQGSRPIGFHRYRPCRHPVASCFREGSPPASRCPKYQATPHPVARSMASRRSPRAILPYRFQSSISRITTGSGSRQHRGVHLRPNEKEVDGRDERARP